MNRTVAAPGLGPLSLRSAAVVGAAAVVLGAMAALQPSLSLLAVGAPLLVVGVFFAPVANLLLLLFLTALVPYGIQNSVGVSGAGLLPSDALLITGIFAALIVLAQERLEPRRFVAIVVVLTFVLAAALQALHGLQEGRSVSQVGYELRVVFGFATVLIAMPIVADPQRRNRLARGLLALGLLVGLWGIAQWGLGLEEINESGVGVREGVSFTTSGRGQLQGGLYAFPVFAVLSFAVLVSGQVRSLSLRLILFATLFLNLASMLLTYERTFWVTTILGLVFVVIKGGRMQRGRALIGIPLTAAILLSVMATIAPAELTAARERLLSIGQYSNDDSVRERIVETRHVLAKIDAHPFVGSGLGDTVFWGRPWQQVPPKAGWYAHNGYLWVAWKLGLLAALLLFALLAWAVFSRGPPVGGPLFRSLRTGSQAALLVLLLSSITFPSFNAVSITATMGVLAAVSLAPRREAVGETADSTAIRGPV